MKHLKALLSAAILGAMIVTIAGAQQNKPRPARPSATDQYEITSQISDAMRYLSSEPSASLAILRRLNTQFPGQERVLTRIGYVMQVMGNADSSEVYYRRALSVNPRSLEAGKSLGMLHISNDNNQQAMRVFEALIEANDHNMSAYKTVGGALEDVGRYDDALSIYESGRDRSKRHFILTLEIAALHAQLGNHERSLDEYLRYVGNQGRNYRFTRGKILELLRNADGAQDGIIVYIDRKLETNKTNRYVLLDILSAHYLERGLLEKSLDAALLADKETQSDGGVLLTLADQIIFQANVQPRREKARYLELGVRALEAFTTNRPRAPGTDRAKYMLGTIYVEFGSSGALASAARTDYLERAVSEFADLSRRYPNSEFAELAYMDRGDVLLHQLKRPKDALDAFKSGAVNSRRYGDLFASRIGDIYLGLADYAAAEHYFESLIRSGVPELIQTGYYYTGLRLGFQGKHAAARDTLTFLAEEDTSSPFTNNAIEVAWVLEEGMQYDSNSLGTYLSALQAEMVGDTVTVLALLGKIVAQPVYETLRPRALYRLGKTLHHTGDSRRAVSVLERFLKEYPEEDLRPDVQREIASVYELGFEQYERALQEYETVLVDYPEYAFLDEVRKDVRRLRFIVKGEEYDN